MSAKLLDASPALPLSEHTSLTADMEMWIERYLDARSSLSKRTQKAYADALLPFVRFCEQYDTSMSIDEIGGVFINHYIVYYIKMLAGYHYGTREIRGKNGAIRDSPTTLSEKEYRKIISNGGQKLNRECSNIVVPKRFEKTVMQRLTILKQLLVYISENNAEGKDYRLVFHRIAKLKPQNNESGALLISELEMLREILRQWPEIFRQHVRSVGKNARRRTAERGLEYVAVRNAFLMLVMSYTGLRAGEALTLTFGDFKRSSSGGREYFVISVKGGKGNKDRIVTAPKEAIGPMLDRLRSYGGFEETPIASALGGGGAVSYASLFVYARHIYKAAGIEKSGFHIIRRAFATEYIAKGGDVETLAKLLGHSSVQTTHEHYVKGNEELLMRRSVH